MKSLHSIAREITVAALTNQEKLAILEFGRNRTTNVIFRIARTRDPAHHHGRIQFMFHYDIDNRWEYIFDPADWASMAPYDNITLRDFDRLYPNGINME